MKTVVFLGQDPVINDWTRYVMYNATGFGALGIQLQAVRIDDKDFGPENPEFKELDVVLVIPNIEDILFDTSKTDGGELLPMRFFGKNACTFVAERIGKHVEGYVVHFVDLSEYQPRVYVVS